MSYGNYIYVCNKCCNYENNKLNTIILKHGNFFHKHEF